MLRRLGLSALIASLLVSILSVYSPELPVVSASSPLYGYSKVTSIPNPWQIQESQTASMPDASILPTFIGSGELGVGIDASGMQMLDFSATYDTRKGVEHFSNASLYVFHRSMYNKLLKNNAVHPAELVNLMPLGFLRYWIKIDNTVIDYANLASYATNWTRTTSVGSGEVETVFILDGKVLVVITAFIPYGSVTPIYKFQFSSADGQPHDIEFRTGIEIKSRSGAAIMDTGTLGDVQTGNIAYTRRRATQGNTSIYEPQATYDVTYGIAAQSGKTVAFSMEPTYLGITHQTSVAASGSQSLDVMFYLGSSESGTHTATAADTALSAYVAGSYSDYLDDNRAEWSDYYGSVADFDLDDTDYEREFLYHQSLYLDRAGQPDTDAAGIYLSYLLFHQPWWQGATFWDSGFVTDQRVKTGRVDAAENFIDWLYSVMRTGSGQRPFSWQLLDDGTEVGAAGGGITWFADGVHALSAIRVYEATKDQTLLQQRVYPIVKQVAEWAVSKYEQISTGSGYVYKLETAGYDTANPLHFYNDLWTNLLLLSVMQKAHDYASANSWTLSSDVADVLSNVWLARGADAVTGAMGYYGAERWDDGVNNAPIDTLWNGVHFSAVAPYMADLSQDMSFGGNEIFSLDRFQRTVGPDFSSHCYVCDTRPDGTWAADEQPWNQFWTASTLRRIGLAGDAQNIIDRTFANRDSYVFGPGYFSEIQPDDQDTIAEGLPPYVTAHASYSVAMLETFVTSSIWSNDVSILASLPMEYQNRSLSAVRVRTANGLEVDVESEPTRAEATLRNATGNNTISRTIRIAVPYNVRTSNVVVKQNGTTLSSGYTIDSARNVVIPNVVVGSSPVVFEVSGSTLSGSPGTPSITKLLRGTLNAKGTQGVVQLHWNRTEGATSYSILRSGTSGGTYTTLATVSDTSFADRTASVGNVYYYKVQANNSAGSSLSSAAGPIRPNYGYRFDSDTVGLDPSVDGGWTEVLGSWAVDNDAQQSKVYKGGVDAAEFSIATAGDSAWTDYRATTKFRFTASDANREASVLVRYQNLDNFLRFFVQGNQVGLQERSGSVWNTPVTTSYTATVGQWYYVAVEVEGTTLRAKIWPDTSAREPDAWTVTLTNVTLSSGAIGLGSNHTRVLFDEVSAIQ